MILGAQQKYPTYLLTLSRCPITVLCWIALIVVSYFYIDQPLAIFLQRFDDTGLYNIAWWVTKLGLGYVDLIPGVVLLLIGQFIVPSPRLRAAGLLLLIAVLVTGAICDISKVTLGRARPSELLDHGVFGFYFWQFRPEMWSFPSGHVSTITATMLSLSLVWPRYEGICVFLIVLVGLSRLLLGMHYFSDVAAAMLLGAWVTLLIYQQLCQRTRWGRHLLPAVAAPVL